MADSVDIKKKSATRGLYSGKTVGNRFEVGDLMFQDSLGGFYECTDKESGTGMAIRIFGSAVTLAPASEPKVIHPSILFPEVLSVPGTSPRYAVFESSVKSSLRDWLQKNRRPRLETVVQVVSLLLEALKALHDHGRVFAQLTPEIVLLGEDFSGALEVCLLDVHIDANSKAPGREYYMAPEQIRGVGAPTPGTDLWAVGVILYEMLYGRRAFVGRNGDEIAQKITGADPDFPVLTGYPAETTAVIRRLLNRDADKRYSTANAAITDVQNLLNAPKAAASPARGAGAAATKTAAAEAVPLARISMTGPAPASAEAPIPVKVASTSKTAYGMPAISFPAAAPAASASASPAAAPPSAPPPPPSSVFTSVVSSAVTPDAPLVIESERTDQALFDDLHTTEISLLEMKTGVVPLPPGAATAEEGRSTTVTIAPEELEAVSEHIPVPPSVKKAAAGSEDISVVFDTDSPSSAPKSRKLVIIAAVAAVLIIAGVVVLFSGSEESPAEDKSSVAAPAPETTPAPIAKPAPAPIAKPAPAPVPEPAPEPAPVAKPDPEPVAKSAPAAKPQPSTTTNKPVASKPVAKKKPASTSRTTSKPSTSPKEKPVAKKPGGLASNPFGD